MMKKLTYIILASLMITSCHRDEFGTKDLPSRELIDSVISFAFKASSNTNLPLKVNTKLLEWKILKNNENLEIQDTFKLVRNFSYEYLNKRLLQQDGLKIFNDEDSLFMTFQIECKNNEPLELKSLENIPLTNSKEIETRKRILKQGVGERLTYFQFSRPLFNKKKNYCVVGLSTFDLCPSKVNHEGGVLIIMKRKGNEWFFVTDIDWWGH